ncbi:DEAD-domain-containing protein [Daldinia caldariorum]|uniref:DEAD-domain-containing protein n=1 Tax=Daldinia caldariorum TaxID=326644 RepID=UPI0020088C40|nr:DEAD-domain-containing protein [Daldinia caldariorum]KAI1470746.1 DEAD-domain-containing protein [Daldinia caldariorum]
MLKSSLQRHARLGNLARRQISTLVSQQIRSRPVVASCQRLAQSERQVVPLRQIALRLYSQQSAAAPSSARTDDSPASIYNVTRFEDLTKLGVDERIIRAITVDMGYDTMTEVQSLTINPALKGVDLVAQAKTGTGKTLGFLVPVFQRLIASDSSLASPQHRMRASSEDIRAIILSPTRELAEQIGVEARKLARHTGIVVQTAVGGTRKREAMHKMNREGCDVLVATPGRLYDIMTDQSTRVAAPRIQSFVLDEADRMLDVGFADAIREIVDILPPIREVDRQTLLYSATIPRDVVHLAKSMVKTDNFDFVQTINPDETPTHARVPQHLVATKGYENWFPAVMELADRAIEQSKQDPDALPFKAIIFFSNTATVQFANRVFKSTYLGHRLNGVPIFDIHSKLSQDTRTRNAEAFRRARTGILISSDVTARGMDFPNVSHVFQLGLPPDRDQYIHRVGRTGRAGKNGEGWLILSEDEIKEARYRLPGLPIKPNQTVKSATHVPGQGTPDPEVAKYFDEVSRAYERAPRDLFAATYNAMLGQKFGRTLNVEAIVRLLNNWCLNGLRWEQTPAISPKSAKNRGLDRVPGIRIGIDTYERDDDRRGFGGGFGGGRGGGGFGGGFDRRGGGSNRNDNFNSGSRFGSRDRRDNDPFSRRINTDFDSRRQPSRASF